MADKTHINWTDATWNIITGCSVLTPGCTNCYAMRLAGTRLKHIPSREGLTEPSKTGPVWTGEVRFNETMLDQPLRWRKPRDIFVCAHGDLFHENVPDGWIDKVFAVMALAPQHRFQVLTKRARRMRMYFDSISCLKDIIDASCEIEGAQIDAGRRPIHDWNDTLPLRNVWLGVSVEDQERADERIPLLLDTPAAVRWISAEPLLGPVDLEHIKEPTGLTFKATSKKVGISFRGVGLDWVVVGGESAQNKPGRPMHPDWARALRDQCQSGGVAFHFKQWGDFLPVYDRDIDDPDWGRCDAIEFKTPKGRWMNLEGGHGFHGDRVFRMDRVGAKKAGRLLDGREWNERPGEHNG